MNVYREDVGEMKSREMGGAKSGRNRTENGGYCLLLGTDPKMLDLSLTYTYVLALLPSHSRLSSLCHPMMSAALGYL